MNRTNALGFLAVGFAFALAPSVAPGLFPRTAIDGSSTRALWVEVMGIVQLGIGAMALIWWSVGGAVRAGRADVEAVVPSANWGEADGLQTIVVVERAPMREPEGSVTLHGAHAELWRAFNHALRRDGHARQLAARLVELAQQTAPAEAAASFARPPEAEFAEQAA